MGLCIQPPSLVSSACFPPIPIPLHGHLHLQLLMCGDGNAHTHHCCSPTSFPHLKAIPFGSFIHLQPLAHTSLFFTLDFLDTFFPLWTNTVMGSLAKEKRQSRQKENMSIVKNGVKESVVTVETTPLAAPPSSLHLSPPIHLCAGDARVSFLSTRFVLTSPGHAPLTLPAEDTRGGEGGG